MNNYDNAKSPYDGSVADATGTAYYPDASPAEQQGTNSGCVDNRILTREEEIVQELYRREVRGYEQATKARRVADILTRHPEIHEFLEVLRSGLVVLLLVFFLACTASAQAKQPTVEELKATIADQAVTIARLQSQVHELQFQVKLYDGASGTADRRQQDQQAVQSAEQASIAAHKVKPAAPAVKPALKK